ncbi:tRNA-binding protein, partial [Salmonella enterica]
ASDAELCARLRISGRKALLALQRAQAAQALIALDAGRTQRLRDVMPGGGEHAG